MAKDVSEKTFGVIQLPRNSGPDAKGTITYIKATDYRIEGGLVIFIALNGSNLFSVPLMSLDSIVQVSAISGEPIGLINKPGK